MARTECRMKNVAAMLAALVLAVAPPISLATTLNFEARITRVLAVEGTKFGGCMAALSERPSREGLDCNAGSWVTFHCAGEYVSKSAAMRMFDTAQMAFLTERKVRVHVDDKRKYNGHCLATRIDVL